MKKTSFNSHWDVLGITDPSFRYENITLPFDCMLREKRDGTSQGGVNSSWFIGGDYLFTKRFKRPQIEEGGVALLEFEGVYRNASITLNGKLIHENAYGYNGFFVDITDYLEEENVIEVKSLNADQPNSRWYSGAGIYRPVTLYVGPKHRIEMNSIKVTPLDQEKGTLRLEASFSESGEVEGSILEGDGKEVLRFKKSVQKGHFLSEITISSPHLWDENDPYLYTLRLSFGEDYEEVRFGFRLLSYGKEGLFINGKRLLLKGACVHHDNGILGAISYRDVEYRKLSLLKSLGYNAIRSAHNPIGKYVLEAADELGIYVIDEYADCWYIHKTRYDYASELEKHYEEDIRLLVEKDYNHPCVVMYSSGNEVSETAQPKGIALTKTLTETFHRFDATRPVTCGVNIFFNALSSLGFGVFSDKKAEANTQAKAKKGEVGSAFFNAITNFVGNNVMKVGAMLPLCDYKTRDAFANMDVAGYNYGLYRYKGDLKRYPKRLILGSETFCCDAAKWLRVAKDNPRIVGDFVWSGIDYLGECGIGSWISEEDCPDLGHGPGWMCAGAGRIDITGKILGEGIYTQVVYGKKPIGLAVIAPKESKRKHSTSAWKYSLAMPYYDFPGQEGGKATAEIYSFDEEVALYFNGHLIKKVKTHKSGNTRISFPYQPGELKAIGYRNGKKVSETSLSSGKKRKMLTLSPEGPLSKNDRLLFVRFRLGDEDGVISPYLKSRVTILDIQGGELLGFGSGCPYYVDSYLSFEGMTYEGEMLAIFRVDDESSFKFRAKSDYGEADYHLQQMKRI